MYTEQKKKLLSIVFFHASNFQGHRIRKHDRADESLLEFSRNLFFDRILM